MHGRRILLLLLAMAIAITIVIISTYSRTYAAQVYDRRDRMHARALAFILLGCVGILVFTVLYAIATEELRRSCNAAAPSVKRAASSTLCCPAMDHGGLTQASTGSQPSS